MLGTFMQYHLPILLSLHPASILNLRLTTCLCAFDWLADEQSRVKLYQQPGVEGSDYINASFIDVSTFYGQKK